MQFHEYEFRFRQIDSHFSDKLTAQKHYYLNVKTGQDASLSLLKTFDCSIQMVQS